MTGRERGGGRMAGLLTTPARRSCVLTAIRVAHTAVWAFFVGCIFAIPVAGALGRFGVAWILTGMVLMECLALAVNRGRCPLTPVAARFTTDRRLGFDIYLPGWVARWNKELFGSIWVLGEIFVLWRRFG
jgi:hypothetical protein